MEDRDFLEELAKKDNCDEECGDECPFVKCAECYAREVLDDVGVTMRYEIDNIKRLYPETKRLKKT